MVRVSKRKNGYLLKVTIPDGDGIEHFLTEKEYMKLALRGWKDYIRKYCKYAKMICKYYKKASIYLDKFCEFTEQTCNNLPTTLKRKQ